MVLDTILGTHRQQTGQNRSTSRVLVRCSFGGLFQKVQVWASPGKVILYPPLGGPKYYANIFTQALRTFPMFMQLYHTDITMQIFYTSIMHITQSLHKQIMHILRK